MANGEALGMLPTVADLTYMLHITVAAFGLNHWFEYLGNAG
jgi:hypothetical protein